MTHTLDMLFCETSKSYTVLQGRIWEFFKGGGGCSGPEFFEGGGGGGGVRVQVRGNFHIGLGLLTSKKERKQPLKEGVNPPNPPPPSGSAAVLYVCYQKVIKI